MLGGCSVTTTLKDLLQPNAHSTLLRTFCAQDFNFERHSCTLWDGNPSACQPSSINKVWSWNSFDRQLTPHWARFPFRIKWRAAEKQNTLKTDTQTRLSCGNLVTPDALCLHADCWRSFSSDVWEGAGRCVSSGGRCRLSSQPPGGALWLPDGCYWLFWLLQNFIDNWRWTEMGLKYSKGLKQEVLPLRDCIIWSPLTCSPIHSLIHPLIHSFRKKAKMLKKLS